MTPRHEVLVELATRRRRLRALELQLHGGGCSAARDVALEALAELTRILEREAVQAAEPDGRFGPVEAGESRPGPSLVP